MVLQRMEERWRNHQLFFLKQTLFYLLSQVSSLELRCTVMELNRRVQRLESGKTANVTQENSSTRLHVLDHAFQHSQQIADIRKVLDHRVYDHGIETLETVE